MKRLQDKYEVEWFAEGCIGCIVMKESHLDTLAPGVRRGFLDGSCVHVDAGYLRIGISFCQRDA